MTSPTKTRPADWTPLASSDPVPGDPEEIREEVRHMKKVAETLRNQAKMLRGIGDDDELRGKYVDKLREESGVLEKHLDEVASRYENVDGLLSSWAGELEDFQQEAGGILAQVKNDPDVNSKSSAGEEEGTDEDALEKYRTKLDRVTHSRDDRGKHFGDRIRDEISDVIEDSTWDDIKGWVHENADWIKVVIDVLGWVATIAGIVAMFIPGLNIAIALVVAGALIFGTRLLLVASGDATWMDVAFDAFGLLTMGVGRAGIAMLRGANKATKAASALQRVSKLKDGIRSHKSVMDDLGRAIAGSADDATKAFARDLRTYIRKKILDDAGRVSLDAPDVSRMARIAGLGDDEAGRLLTNVMRNDEVFTGAGRTGLARTGYGASTVAAWSGTGVDFTDKLFGNSDAWSAASEEWGFSEKWSHDGYNDWKGSTGVPAVDNHW